MDYPKTRAEAKATGAQYYLTGIPCRRGHVALRKTKGVCVECMKEDWQIDNERRKDKPKSKAAIEAGRRYYERNKELVKAKAKVRPKEKVAVYKQNHKKNNPEYYKALTSVRKRRHKNATPLWINADQKMQMRKLYLSAQEMTKITGERYVVDHIVPLINEAVCGLHVPWNLRVITQKENLLKSNKLGA
jgi:hypothetical protein